MSACDQSNHRFAHEVTLGFSSQLSAFSSQLSALGGSIFATWVLKAFLNVMIDVTGRDLLNLLVLALPVAAIAWTVTHEEVLREFHEYCTRRSRDDRAVFTRKFFYLFTCEYCFSHYVSAAAIFSTRFTLLFDDWRGYVIAWLAVVWVANHLIGLYGRLRLGIRSERLEIGIKEAVSERAGAAKAEERPRAHERRAG